MQNKTVEWSKKWDALNINKNTNSGKFLAICTLLTQYAKSDHSGNYGMMFRFLHGNWGTNHGYAVAVALQNAGKYSVQQDGEEQLSKEEMDAKYEQKIKELMSELVTQMNGADINQDGDFAGLKAAIELKTGFSFDEIQNSRLTL